LYNVYIKKDCNIDKNDYKYHYTQRFVMKLNQINLMRNIMKKLAVVLVLAIVLAAFPISTVSANAGGAPALHGVDGKTFGFVISNLAQSAPGALAAHVSNSGGNGGGMPAAHGVDGKTLGSLVSGLAQMYPGALAGHVSGK
jgi:hypothetical protein